jgi:hypothetical protein
LGGLKIAELDHVVGQIARNSVAEISALARPIKRGVGWGAVIGGGAGLVTLLLYCKRHGCEKGQWILDVPFSAGFGGGIGSGIGAVLGAAWGKTQDLIYRAP